jgi:glycosyltransferase involved in cell wall biosynthesis
MRVLYGHAFGIWARLRAWWKFRIKKESPPDVIYTVAWFLPRCDVCHVHFSPWDWEKQQQVLGTHSLRDFIERTSNHLGRWTANRFLHRTTAKRILCVSVAVAQDVRQANPASEAVLRVLPNSFDPARFNSSVRAVHRAATRNKLGFQDEDHIFIFVSTGHYRRKGFFLAAESIAKLRKDTPTAKLLVVGGGEDRLRDLQSELDRQFSDWREFIIFTGNVTDVERHFAAADALLFPSYSEAFALVEVEAAACGLPLFLTRHHGSEMILEDGVNGRFIEFDSTAIANVLHEFMTGKWKPSPSSLSRALDADTWETNLIDEIKNAARHERVGCEKLIATTA